MDEHRKFLENIQPFKGLPPEDLRALAASAREKSFDKGETIFSEGSPADSVWVLHKGRIQILKYTQGGKPFAIESLGPGELFGTLCRMGNNGRTYPCTAVASGPVTALRIPDGLFLGYYMKSPGLVRGICALCTERLKDAQDLRCMGQESVPVRVASTLLRLHRVHGAEIPFTKKEVSELVGTTLETTFRTLSDFQKQNLLTSLRGKIRIKNLEKLKSLSEDFC